MQGRNSYLIRVLVDELNREYLKRDACIKEIHALIQDLKDLGVDQHGFPLPEAVANKILTQNLSDPDMEDTDHEPT